MTELLGRELIEEDFDGSQMPAMMGKSMKASNVPLTTEFKELFANFHVSANDFVFSSYGPRGKKIQTASLTVA